MVKLYDTTLRDGGQAEDVSFTLEDKIRIAHKLDELGVHYIEGGWPGANPKDSEFFTAIKKENLKHAKITAFGSTRRAKNSAEEDPNLQALVKSGADVVTIFGKSWLLHVEEALQITKEDNLRMIYSSIAYLKKHFKEVFYDAEHFFDGYKNNSAYALQTLQVAIDAGADMAVLCDTNGGTLLQKMASIIEVVKKNIKVPFGIHAHNDSDVAVANSLLAIGLGASQVQGTINGYGERCGNANLCSIIPNLKLKMGIDCISDEQLVKLRQVSGFVDELANLKPRSHQPYVGKSAFAHKGGMHVSAVRFNSNTYEHVNPKAVGNEQRILVSELSGRSSVVYKAKDFGVKLNDDVVASVVNIIKRKEAQGYHYEAADGSLELLMYKINGERKKFFDLIGFRLTVAKRHKSESVTEATLKIKIGDSIEHTVAEGNGPVNALDQALRKALIKHYPELSLMELRDYKVRILDEHKGTKAKTRVLIESGNDIGRWGTVGVSENIIEASWQALVDGITYYLHKHIG